MSSRQGQGAARRRVDVVVDRLLDAVEEPWPLHRMAKVAGYAPHHFHRLFSATMGETPHRFVSRVRVERAAALLHADPGLSLTEAAAAAGFSSPSQLSREFRARFGRTASGWNRGEPLHDRAEHRVLADLPLRRAPPGGVDAVKVLRLPGFGFAYRRILDPYGSPRLAAAFVELGDWLTAATARGESSRWLIGMSWDDPDVVPAELCRYDLGVTAGPLEAVPPGTTRRWVPTCAAASLAVRGDLAEVDVAWQRLHRSWLPTSSYGQAALPAMEWFHTTPPTNPSGHWNLDCLVPVVLHRKIRQAAGHRRGR